MESIRFNEKKRERYLGCIRKGMRHGEAARAAKIDRTTVWKYKKEHPEFAAEIERAEADACDEVERCLLQAIRDNLSIPGMIFWLTNRSPDRWRDRRNVGVTQNIIASDLTEEQLK